MSDNEQPQTFLEKILTKIPSPLLYLQNVVRGDTPERVSAFLAVLAGLALVAGFCGITIAITVFKQKLTTELITISGALVTLATFSKVDRNTISTNMSTQTNVISNITEPVTKVLPKD